MLSQRHSQSVGGSTVIIPTHDHSLLREDSNLAWRLLAGGERLEYVPDTIVEHHFHEDRPSERHFVEYFTRQGRSRWALEGCPSALRILPEYGLAPVRERVVSRICDDDRRVHVHARRLHHKAMLDSARWGEPVPFVLAGESAPACS